MRRIQRRNDAATASGSITLRGSLICATVIGVALIIHSLTIQEYGGPYDSDMVRQFLTGTPTTTTGRETTGTIQTKDIPYYLRQPHIVNLNIEKGNFSNPRNQSFIPNMVALNHPLIQFKLAVESYWADLGERGRDIKRKRHFLDPPAPPLVPPNLTVAIWPLFDYNMSTAEELQLEFDGIHESLYLHLAPTSSGTNHYFSDESVLADNLVWVGDTGATSIGWSNFCGGMVNLLKEAQAIRARHGMTVQWPIIVLDWTDQSHPRQRCLMLELLVGREFVFYTKRSIAIGRQWNGQWPDIGELADLSVGTDGSPYMKYTHAPLAVRTDTVLGLKMILEDEDFHHHFNLSEHTLATNSDSPRPNLTLASPIELMLDRPFDVAHLWPLQGRTGTSSELRGRVSEIIEREFGTNNKNNYKYNAFVGVTGLLARQGRRGVSNKYLEQLLNTKILVLSQRADWEDHYRLFEGLVSGAMVMTDRMLSLPAGLQNGTSVVEYTSADDLVAKVVYYLEHPNERLAIAAAGRHVAMSRHRSWHRMEDLIYGLPVTQCLSTVNPDCPFVVHANEGLYLPSSMPKENFMGHHLFDQKGKVVRSF